MLRVCILCLWKRPGSEGFRAEGEAGGAGRVEPFKFRATARSFLGAGHLNEGFQRDALDLGVGDGAPPPATLVAQEQAIT